jgi:hypothetical protein
MSDNNFSDREIAAARLAAEIEDDIDRQLEESEILIFAELSKKSADETRARLQSQIFLERKTRAKFDMTGERDRKRLMFWILYFVCQLNKEFAGNLCSFFNALPGDGASAMGMGL